MKPSAVNIYASKFLDQSGENLLVGGVQTIVRHLAEFCVSQGRTTQIFQFAKKRFRTVYHDIKIIGVPFRGELHRYMDPAGLLRDYAARQGLPDGVIEVFGTDLCSRRLPNPRTILIQHGIFWDTPANYLWRFPRSRLSERLFRLWLRHRALRDFETCPYRVCVDLNFLNWYRTYRGDRSAGNIWYIPNPAESVPWRDERALPALPLRVIFARRLCPMRGTRVFADSVKSVLSQRSDVCFTFAGVGPDECFLKGEFKGEDRVQFTRYSSQDAVRVHQEHDIAVIPSLGSEGTALAVVEAMAAGCAVVGTAVGGITNQIIDGFNGLLVQPEPSDITRAVLKLIDSPQLRQQIQRRGWETVQSSFSLAEWRHRWSEVLAAVAGSPSGPKVPTAAYVDIRRVSHLWSRVARCQWLK